ncbi:similar to Saccharomyces cerevisiae YIL160C POT1 3-ketoacyl-CoA thiolase with broad chain length specificity [Maudiozyma barnettii]|uniref:acetyl-CoA C-acyltransferase n=1 Tax=Maudiozyma barnettii TaxID=61262 RepID=A0A8H2VIA3_9SACH|nr:acetyl-CoA C-acyltransferase [Kazachstania barnettii]CAB4256055.1 similar to Saccharomyces cerevisiae YIL160C POT1 3-ketoacyl-CoA thiolase with broad chain length specificity [Kazachstania barnettii]CAD1784663.1 similar to Saccharomyces cerevisiae YIL160C POT1 3-ketoacyl-CoA thiolase with broad chain length specificity [Kazachstania barnettii]
MSQRLQDIKNHIAPDSVSTTQNLKIIKESKNPDDIVIIAANRSAITKGFKGGFNDINTDYLLVSFLKEFIEIWPKSLQENLALVEDITCGNVLNVGAGATEHRAAMLAAGFPYQTSFNAINRQCSSGLTAVNDIANKISSGQIDIGLALGVESMSKNYKNINPLGSISEELLNDKNAKKCLIPMGLTNELIAKNFNINRNQQDSFASKSNQKAIEAIKQGLFKDEILPLKSPSSGKIIDTDEGPRENVSVDSLSKLNPAFIKDPKKNGTTTAGNSSQISDGVAGVLLARRSVAESLGLPIMARYLAFQVIGVPPEIMGVGPAFVIPKLLSKLQLSINDIDIFEINEAFAAQCLYCANILKIDQEKINPRGGAIALGHPLGCTGARQVATIMRELQTGQIGIVSMCIGTGMGAAAAFLKE